MTFAATPGTECPACDVEGDPTGKFGPAQNVSCNNDECPVDLYWAQGAITDFDGFEDADPTDPTVVKVDGLGGDE